MKKIVLMLLAMVVFGNIFGENANEIVKKAGLSYHNFASITNGNREEVWFQGESGNIYYFKHYNDPVLIDRAKTYLSVLLSAISTGYHVSINYSPADADYTGNSSYRKIVQICISDLN